MREWSVRRIGRSYKETEQFPFPTLVVVAVPAATHDVSVQYTVPNERMLTDLSSEMGGMARASWVAHHLSMQLNNPFMLLDAQRAVMLSTLFQSLSDNVPDQSCVVPPPQSTKRLTPESGRLATTMHWWSLTEGEQID